MEVLNRQVDLQLLIKELTSEKLDELDQYFSSQTFYAAKEGLDEFSYPKRKSMSEIKMDQLLECTEEIKSTLLANGTVQLVFQENGSATVTQWRFEEEEYRLFDYLRVVK